MITLDANQYRINFPNIKSFTSNKNEDELLDSIGILAITTSVPIIVVACYVGELYGFFDRLVEFIKRLFEFYKIDGVENVSGELYA